MASVYSFVPDLPPKSLVIALPSAIVPRVAFSILSATSYRFMCLSRGVSWTLTAKFRSLNMTHLSIISEDRSKAVGLASPLPSISGAEP